jgi:hypothetical protein
MMIKINKNNEVVLTDYRNMAIRKIDRFGNVATIVGPNTRVPNSIPPFIFRYWYPISFIEDDNGNIYVSSNIDVILKFNCSSSTNSSHAISQATPDADLPSWEDVGIVDQLPFDPFPFEQPNLDPPYSNSDATSSYQVTMFLTSESLLPVIETNTMLLNPTETQVEPPTSQPATTIEFIKRVFDLTSLPGLLTAIGSVCVLLVFFGCGLYCCIRRYHRRKAIRDTETQLTLTTDTTLTTETDFSSIQSSSSYLHSEETAMSHQSSNRTATLFADPQGTKEKKNLSYHEIRIWNFYTRNL